MVTDKVLGGAKVFSADQLQDVLSNKATAKAFPVWETTANPIRASGVPLSVNTWIRGQVADEVIDGKALKVLKVTTQVPVVKNGMQTATQKLIKVYDYSINGTFHKLLISGTRTIFPKELYPRPKQLPKDINIM